jgi:hypothetical protein
MHFRSLLCGAGNPEHEHGTETKTDDDGEYSW